MPPAIANTNANMTIITQVIISGENVGITRLAFSTNPS